MKREKNAIPAPPPLPTTTTSDQKKCFVTNQSASIKAAREIWESLFNEAYRADVVVHTECGGRIYAHASILGMASPVMKNKLKQSRKQKDRRRSITIRGVPHNAVHVFIRFLYSSCYDEVEMEEFVMHLLVLSHAFGVPHLKRECEKTLENSGMLETENVMDVFQLALLCDASRLSLVCHRVIHRNLKAVLESDGWKAMKESHPVLEKLILESVGETDMTEKAMARKRNERKIYAQLYGVMEALVHICKDGCRTIGPYDKVLKPNMGYCGFAACKGIEQLVRHFAACKLRGTGGCGHCKRMWKLLELHSRLCVDSDACKVPLCRNFKVRREHNKKEEVMWRILVKRIVWSRTISGAPYFSLL